MIHSSWYHVKGNAMKHVKTISRVSMPAQGETTVLESVILLLLTVFFSSWDNFRPVLQNLTKFYQKT